MRGEAADKFHKRAQPGKTFREDMDMVSSRRCERCYSGPSRGSVVQVNLSMETIPVSERRTHSQRPRTVGPCSPRQRPRKCQLADLYRPGRTRFLPTDAA